MKKWVLLVAVVFFGFPLPIIAVDKDAEDVSYCMGVFGYAGNYFMLQDNEGAAKLMIFQLARSTVTLLSMFYDNGKVSGETLAGLEPMQTRAKADLDQNLNSLSGEIDRCVGLTNEQLKLQERKGIVMWGKSLQEVIGEMTPELQKRIGLQ